MHVPPYHKKPGWQLIFVGFFFGSIISYIIFIYMYGTMYDEILKENIELSNEVTELQHTNQTLLKDKEDLSEQTKQPLTISKITIQIEDPDSAKIDLLMQDQLRALIHEEINHVIGEEVELISRSDQLLTSTIENKAFTLDGLSFYFVVQRIVYGPELKISILPDSVQ
ncbi:sporulation membrane protein YtrI [Oceanobacillus sp. J11TS1]|uniref:sporulation membrane protein YtrI n=1 Tax=Oceanobacillus sp. J11TS1 TaxID=2807191 RepID=UPI001B1C1144|nr:sporulation membrane protein YtrI [Oceanobacillus sp. J11TS1]GIO22402.1 sporulation membrane protein YtrI [Oceanobacillus sp. J11TS1]